MLTKNKKLNTIISVLIWILAIASTFFLLTRKDAGVVVKAPASLYMYLELFVIAAWIFIAIYFVESSYISWGLIVIVTYLFLWLHRIALPIIISGLYVTYLCILGSAFLNLISKERTGDRIKLILKDFLTGASLHICVVCILSIFGIGGVVTSRIVAIVLLVLSILYIFAVRFTKKRIVVPIAEIPSEDEIKKEAKARVWIVLALSLSFAMLLLQAGRINIALDYDSLHYGLDSGYVLDNGNGIYEYLGSVNDVFIYPKGLEILALPLNTDTTYGIVLSFSWWMIVGALVCIYYIVEKLNSRRAGIYAVFVASTIPGIMNMATSAKTDAITLFIQLIAIAFILDDDYVCAGAALLFTLTLKPTSLLFSGLIFLVALVNVIVKKKKMDLKKWYYSIPVILAFVFVTARTIKLAGVPMAASAASLWKALGFTYNYPFNGTGGFRVSGYRNLKDYIKILIGFFICPVGDDLAHVYIAWGGLGTLILSFFGIFRKEKDDRTKLIKILLVVILITSIACIYTLYQIDGNYFTLLYALAVILFFSSDYHFSYVIPILVLNILMCTVTNWSCMPGLTTMKFNHYGFYDHESDTYDTFVNMGNKDIYEYLARDKRQRVLAMAEQTGCQRFKCNVQSYTDLEGGGGNVALVKTLDEFKKFLAYAGTDYIYVSDEFLDTHSRAKDLVTYMLEEGALSHVLGEGTYRLYKIEK